MARKNLGEKRAEKLAQLDVLKVQIAAMEEKAAKRLGKLAVKAGLADLNLKDAELVRGFEELAARFRERAGNGAGQGAQTPQSDGHTGEAV